MFIPIIAMAALAVAPSDDVWVKVGETPDSVVHYINVDTLKRSGAGRVTVWSRIELPKPTFGKETKSMRVLLEHDCLLHKQRYLQVVSYTGSNLTGHVEFEVGKGHWAEIELDSIGSFIHNNICKYR